MSELFELVGVLFMRGEVAAYAFLGAALVFNGFAAAAVAAVVHVTVVVVDFGGCVFGVCCLGVSVYVAVSILATTALFFGIAATGAFTDCAEAVVSIGCVVTGVSLVVCTFCAANADFLCVAVFSLLLVCVLAFCDSS